MQDDTIGQLLREGLRDEPPSKSAVARAQRLMPSPVTASLRAFIEAARGLVAELRLDSRLSPSLPGFRGAGDGFQLVYAAGDCEVFLNVQAPPTADPAAPAGSQWFRIKGQIDAEQGPGSVQVAFVESGSPDLARETECDARGIFELRLPAGRYDLAIGTRRPLLIPGVEVA